MKLLYLIFLLILCACSASMSLNDIDGRGVKLFEYGSFYSKRNALRFADTKEDTARYVVEIQHTSRDSLFLASYIKTTDSSLYWEKRYLIDTSKIAWLLGIDSVAQIVYFIYPTNKVFDQYHVLYKGGRLVLDYTKCGAPPLPIDVNVLQTSNGVTLQKSQLPELDSLMITFHISRQHWTDFHDYRYHHCYQMPLEPSLLGL